MKDRLISAILRSAWAIDPRFALSHMFLIENMLGRKLEIADNAEKVKEPVLSVLSASVRKKVNSWKDAEPGSIAIVPILGPLEKNDVEDCDMMSYGMNTIAQWIKDAEENPNIDGILLNIDTPGGTADGTQNLADVIKKTSKPVVAFVDGLMASAGLWIGSAAKYIIAQNNTTEIGSIGVMLSFMDTSGFYEAKGIKIHYITADQSADKNLDYLEALKGNYELVRKSGLNPLAEEFIANVKANREGKIPDKAPVFSGKVFFAPDALKHGLIDEIAPFENAVEHLRNMVAEHKNQTQSKPKKTDMKKFATLMALLGLQAIEETDEGVYLNAEQLDIIEARLQEAIQAEADRDTANTALQTAQNAITERDSTIETLKKKPGAETSKVIQSNDKHDEKNELVDFCATHSTADAMAKLKEEGF
jgi:protease-4